MGSGRRARARPMGVGEAAAFLAELANSGNVRRALTAADVSSSTAYRLRASDAKFAAAWEAALGTAAERLATRAAAAPGADTVRRQSRGRPQLTAPRRGEWSARTERVFLDVLSATANGRAAADAAGVSVSGAWVRRRRLPAFAAAWNEAVDDGHARLEMLLMERGTSLLGGEAFATDGDARSPEGRRRDEYARDEDARDEKGRDAFDPQIAMWLLKRRDQSRTGTAKPARPWQRVPDIEEVRESIMRKLDAIRRMDARKPGRAGGGDGSAGDRAEYAGASATIGGEPLDTRTHDP